MKICRMCLNWKVLVGVGLVGVGIWAVAPNLFLAALPLLLLAACPLSMLAMMWGMNRVMQSGHNSSRQPRTSLIMGRGAEQKERLAELKAQQAAINLEIAELKGRSPQVETEEQVGYRPDGDAGEPRA